MTVTSLKPPSAFDPNRKALAAAISLAAGAKRDARVADEAARQAAQNCWEAQSRLEKLREAAEPSGSLADTFAASVAAGNPCNVAVLERSGIDARAKITAAENDFKVWDQTREECDLAAREKEADVATAKDRVERAARMVLADPATVTRLADDLDALQSDIVERRSALRYIWGHGINGELPRPLNERVERLLCRDLLGLEPTSAAAAWSAAFEKLMTDSEASLPEFAGIA
jgi:hypothetical protein